MDVVLPKGRRNHRGFGFVVTGWLRGRDVDLSAPIETAVGAFDFLDIVSKNGTHVAWVSRVESPARRQILRGEYNVADSRIYVVKHNNAQRLVRAGNPAQAIRHVAKKEISAEVASQDQLVELAGKGVTVEDAGENA